MAPTSRAEPTRRDQRRKEWGTVFDDMDGSWVDGYTYDYSNLRAIVESRPTLQ